MSFPGIGVMLSELSGNGESATACRTSVGKKIASIKFHKDEWDASKELRIAFTDGTMLAMFDDGQSCCESRYMTTDDDLSDFVGSTLLGAETVSAPSIEAGYDCYEVQFLHIKTSIGVFTIETHNEHNGYYGGFAIRCRLDTPEASS